MQRALSPWTIPIALIIVILISGTVNLGLDAIHLYGETNIQNQALDRIETLSLKTDLATRVVFLEVLDQELSDTTGLNRYLCPGLRILDEAWSQQPPKLHVVVQKHCSKPVE